eukprot:351341-Chlamydomonas_euryale.AAC.4
MAMLVAGALLATAAVLLMSQGECDEGMAALEFRSIKALGLQQQPQRQQRQRRRALACVSATAAPSSCSSVPRGRRKALAQPLGLSGRGRRGEATWKKKQHGKGQRANWSCACHAHGDLAHCSHARRMRLAPPLFLSCEPRVHPHPPLAQRLAAARPPSSRHWTGARRRFEGGAIREWRGPLRVGRGWNVWVVRMSLSQHLQASRRRAVAAATTAQSRARSRAPRRATCARRWCPAATLHAASLAPAARRAGAGAAPRPVKLAVPPPLPAASPAKSARRRRYAFVSATQRHDAGFGLPHSPIGSLSLRASRRRAAP